MGIEKKNTFNTKTLRTSLSSKLKPDSGEVPEINSGTLACIPSCKLGNWLFFDDGSYKKENRKYEQGKSWETSFSVITI